MKFQPKTTDYQLSPYTGLTRESWLEAGRYLLEGIFQNIDDFSKPVVMPRKETEITYPHLNESPENQAVQRTAEVFEGLTRSFFIAAPLIASLPDLEICGYSMAEYYKDHVLRVCTKGDVLYVGTYEDQQKIVGKADPFRTFQQTVETCALVICLWVSSSVPCIATSSLLEVHTLLPAISACFVNWYAAPTPPMVSHTTEISASSSIRLKSCTTLSS